MPKRYEDLEVYSAYCLITSENNPVTYKEAIMLATTGNKLSMLNLQQIKSLTLGQLLIYLMTTKEPNDTKGVFRIKSDGIK